MRPRGLIVLAPSQPAQDSVSFDGTATSGGPLWRFVIDTRSGPGGENPTGQVSVDRADGT